MRALAINIGLVIAMLLAIGIPLFACVAHAQDRTIRADYGGLWNTYAANVERAATLPGRTVIDGLCASACTMYLRNANTCATRRALFVFHSGGRRAEGRQTIWDTPEQNEALMAYYPGSVQRWIERRGGLPQTDDINKMPHFSGARFGVPACRRNR